MAKVEGITATGNGEAWVTRAAFEAWVSRAGLELEAGYNGSKGRATGNLTDAVKVSWLFTIINNGASGRFYGRADRWGEQRWNEVCIRSYWGTASSMFGKGCRSAEAQELANEQLRGLLGDLVDLA